MSEILNNKSSGVQLRRIFLEHFMLLIADTPALQDEAYKIRYKVYCQELQYEKGENHPDGLERDVYDRRSIHCLLWHWKSNRYAGCVRLVLPDPRSPQEHLPFEAILPDKYSWFHSASLRFPYGSYGEISRLAITKEFRTRIHCALQFDSAIARQPDPNDDTQYFPLIPLGLYLAATSLAVEVGLDRVFALMEARLARHLRRFGITFEQVTDFFEFHGQRGVFQVTRTAALRGMHPGTKDLYHSLSFSVRRSLPESPFPVYRRREKLSWLRKLLRQLIALAKRIRRITRL